MSKALFEAVFEKAQQKSGKTTKSGMAEFLSDSIEESQGFPVTSKTLTRYYDKFIMGKENQAGSPKLELLNALSVFLGYDDYGRYLEESDKGETGEKGEGSDKGEKSETEDGALKTPINGERVLLILVSMVLLITLGYNLWGGNSGNAECMVWKEDHFEEISCDISEHPDLADQIIPKQEILLSQLRQIQPDTTTVFFDENKDPKVWYGKGVDGQYEFFTTYGIHPETGKSLKPITDYMIDKYIPN